MTGSIEGDVVDLARQIAELGRGERASVYRLSWWTDRLLDVAMQNPAFKTELFRFVDVFPATDGDADVLRHLEEYFDGERVPRVLRAGIGMAESVPGIGDRVAAAVATRNIRRMAEQFIVGTGPDDAVPGLRQLWDGGSAFTVDLLGEKTVIDAEAGRYATRVEELLATLTAAVAGWPRRPLLEADDLGSLPRVNVSIKPTALSSKFAPLTAEQGLEQAKARIRPLLHAAADRGAFVHFDMEHHEAKDLTLRLFRELLDEDELRHVDAGIVVQAYLRDAVQDLEELVVWSAARPAPVTVRLVKGAYWDTETVLADAAGWPSPVFARKDHTDASFEECVRLLHDHHGAVRAAFGSHNLRSLAYAVAYARSVGIPDHGYELQMLHGMAEPVQAAIRRLGLRLRVYCPVGELVPGMAYLVRRLLENTSNESFVRHRYAEGRALEELLRPPDGSDRPGPPEAARRDDTDPDDPGTYRPEPPAQWWREDVRERFEAAVAVGARAGVIDVPAVIGGERVRTPTTTASVDPGRPARTVAVASSCGAADADAAVAAATVAWPGWQRTPVGERAAVLFRAAAWMRARRPELAALEVYEAGKPRAEADGDVCEAIDFCEYYGREMQRLGAGGRVDSPPGERNDLRYRGRGVGAVIAPWNFPLAIPTGMTVAALVAGNAVVLKPAEQTPAVAYRLVEALEAGGLPPGVLSFLPGPGETVGARLVGHPDVAFIAFTGSLAVGLEINRRAAVAAPGQRHVKRVIAEMGGKNALVVDADADLDQAVPAVIVSAFGYSGQKCSAASRVVVLDAVYDAFVERLVAAARELTIGHPSDPAMQMGPLIDAEAHDRVRRYAVTAGAEGRMLLDRTDGPDEGWFAGPVVVDQIDPRSAVATEEIFGPLLSVFRAPDFDSALDLANDTPFALSAGILSRSPAHIARASAELRAGNVYVNRGITGAVVGRQPFGGYGLSGVGSKAGGPDYLLQFLEPRVITENTLRQGFAPEA